ncbi:MAG: Vps62-related protein [bacterium]
MFSFRLITTFIVVMALVILTTGCKKTTTEETFEPKLLLSNLSVAIVPSGTENITITARDEHDSTLTFSVECDDENIATVTKTDSTITVTGKNYGTTNVTVSCGGNLTKTIPVEVYDFKVLGADELIIEYVDQFEYRWCSLGSGDTWHTSFYHPVATNGFHALGSYSFRELSNPNERKSVVVVKAKEGSDALAPPVDYDSIWSTHGSGIDDNGSLWNPVPPDGYKALGTVAQRGYNKPSLDDVVCVRNDLTVPGDWGQALFGGDNGRARCMSYLIYPPDAGPHDSCYLTTGSFVGMRTWPDSSGYLVLFLLKIMVPKLPDPPEQYFTPVLTGYEEPPKQTAPVMEKEVVLPWTMIKDEAYSEIWRYLNSPKYRVERRVFYQLEFHNHNKTSVLQTNTYKKTVGVTTDKYNTIKASVGLSLSYEEGISAGFLGFGGEAKITATFSVELGYEYQWGISELQQKEIDVSINTPPGKAAALWRKYNRFIVKRHKGTALETVGTWDIGTESYVTDEYPHER